MHTSDAEQGCFSSCQPVTPRSPIQGQGHGLDETLALDLHLKWLTCSQVGLRELPVQTMSNWTRVDAEYAVVRFESGLGSRRARRDGGQNETGLLDLSDEAVRFGPSQVAIGQKNKIAGE